MSSPAQLTETLLRLSAGARLWFWLCPEAQETPLLMTLLSEDPEMEQLRDLALRVTRSPLSAQIAGLGQCNESGVIDLLAEGLTKSHLKVISRFVREHLEDHPPLARLRGMRLLVLAEDGQTIQKILHHAPLWEGIPEDAAPGSVAATVKRLETSTPGARLRLWMTQSGPGGAPFIISTDVHTDPDGASLNAQIRAALRRGAAGAGQHAIYSHRAEGRALLVTDAIEETLTALMMAWPTLPPMAIEVKDV